MQYLLMIYGQESLWATLSPAESEQMMGAYGAYTEALIKAGVMTGANRLQPSATATTVRLADGKSQVLDGPYADSKEQLGGYYLIDVPDLDSAIAWAARCPAALWKFAPYGRWAECTRGRRRGGRRGAAQLWQARRLFGDAHKGCRGGGGCALGGVRRRALGLAEERLPCESGSVAVDGRPASNHRRGPEAQTRGDRA